jgi:hypothetical protein
MTIHVYDNVGLTKASFSDDHFDEVFDGGQWGQNPIHPHKKAYLYDRIITLRHSGIGIIVYIRPGDYAVLER